MTLPQRVSALPPFRLAIVATLVAQALDFAEVFPRPWGPVLAATTLALAFTRTLWHSASVWALVALVDLGPILTRPLFLPNHHFLTFYVALMLALAGTIPPRAAAVAAHNARLIVAAVMGLAAAQKVLAPGYIDYMGYMTATGGFGEPVVVHLDLLASALGRNSAEAARFLAGSPTDSATLSLRVPGSFGVFATAVAGLVVAFEMYLAVMVLARPRSAAFHLGLVGFLALLGFIRTEFIFLCVLTALGLLLTSDRPTRWRWAYVLLLVAAAPLAIVRLAAR